MYDLTSDEAKAVLDKVVKLSKAEGCEASLRGSRNGNIRYARNTVTTSGVVFERSLAVTSSYGKRQGTATINELDDASLLKVVRRSEELAKLAPENPEFMPVLGPQKYPEVNAWFDKTAGLTAEDRAGAAAASISRAKKAKLVAAGFLEDSAGFRALRTSAGLYAYHRSTGLDFSLTARSEDGTGSGYVTRDYNDAALFDAGAVSAIAVDKGLQSREARAIEPGKYTVVLEPAASIGLLNRLFFGLDARRADEGRSFLSKPGGGSRLGEKLVDERVTVISDPTHAEVPSAPWAEDGEPRAKTTWIDKGVIKTLAYSRYWAKKNEVASTPGPANVVMSGGKASLAELIAGTERGILVTRTWYIRGVDPQTLLFTGLTRDGTFFIEKGKIQFPIKNLRFNESPIIMLNNLEALGKPERMNGDLIPPMRIADFTFTSLSDAV